MDSDSDTQHKQGDSFGMKFKNRLKLNYILQGCFQSKGKTLKSKMKVKSEQGYLGEGEERRRTRGCGLQCCPYSVS